MTDIVLEGKVMGEPYPFLDRDSLELTWKFFFEFQRAFYLLEVAESNAVVELSDFASRINEVKVSLKDADFTRIGNGTLVGIEASLREGWHFTKIHFYSARNGYLREIYTYVDEPVFP